MLVLGDTFKERRVIMVSLVVDSASCIPCWMFNTIVLTYHIERQEPDERFLSSNRSSIASGWIRTAFGETERSAVAADQVPRDLTRRSIAF